MSTKNISDGRVLLLGLLLAGMVTGVKLLSPGHLGMERPFLLYVIPIVVVALIGSVRVALAVFVLVMLLVIYVFLPPHYALVLNSSNSIEVAIYAAQNLFIIWLAQKVQQAQRRARSLNEDLEKKVRRRTRELEKSNRELAAQKQELLRLNQSINEFASLASHQLRTPATGIKQYLGMLLEGFAGTLTDEQLVLLRQAHQSNERQLRIIDDLLQISRLDAGKVTLQKRRTDINLLARDVVAELADVFKSRDQQVTVSPSRKRAIIAELDTEKMRMVLENLVENASKYTPEGKRIRIELQADPRTVAIEVIDEGVGISPADVEKLFTRFTRIDNALSSQVGGSGLGLYWAKRIVDLHDGEISVSSEPGKGSIFRVVIPSGRRASGFLRA